MATKKKAVKKKAVITNAAKNAAEIWILPDGSVFPPSGVQLDGNGVKHPSKVYWQAQDITKTYQIVLQNPPAPFKNVTFPIQTDASGATPALKVDKKYPNGIYGYSIMQLIREKFIKTSAGGIIIDS
jgi:hypothetical protein